MFQLFLVVVSRGVLSTSRPSQHASSRADRVPAAKARAGANGGLGNALGARKAAAPMAIVEGALTVT